MTWSPLLAPVELLTGTDEQPERRLAGIRPRPRSRSTLESLRKVHRLRVTIEKDLVRVKTVEFKSALRLRASHRIRIVLRAAKKGLGNPAMPDPRRLITQVIEAISENRVY